MPFYLRTGKRLPKQVTEVAIQFQSPPLAVFDGEPTTPNLLILRIQPEEGISLKFVSKRPGQGMQLRPVSMDFDYGASFGERSPSAYETLLLLDAMAGDNTLYTRQDMVEASWAVVDPIQHKWDETPFDFPNYPAGSWGPVAADEMLAPARPRVEETVTADSILHELHDLWVNAGHAHEAPGPAGGLPHGEVLRACTMTLFVLADEADDPAAIWELLAALMPQHPSRAILLRFHRGAGRATSMHG